MTAPQEAAVETSPPNPTQVSQEQNAGRPRDSRERRPIALLLAYDGSAFKGWQKQPGLPTVQGFVERALAELLGTKIEVFGAARTDAGVHAEGQVCHFVRLPLSAQGPEGLARFEPELRAKLGSPVRLEATALAHPSFHARSSSTGKRYRYRYGWGEAPQVPGQFHLGKAAAPDWEKARAALQGLLGLPQLTGLASPSKDHRPAPPLESFLLEPSGDASAGTCALELRAPAFRKHQVRNVAGHLAAVALGLALPETLAQLAQRRRPWMGATAPPGGLTLIEVLYPAGLEPFGRGGR
jgi:tRNA pseudouridine38-40 synthase